MASLIFGILGVASASADDKVSAGRNLFVSNCSPCHGADGTGAPGAFPSLRGTIGGYFATDAGRRYLSHLLLTGISGKIVSGGNDYFGAMPAFQHLSDKEIEEVLLYVQRELNGPHSRGEPISMTQIAAARADLAGGGSTKALREEAVKESK